MISSQAHAKGEVALGSLVASTPVLTGFLHDLSFGLSFVASACGAIIGLHGVWRIVRHHWPRS